MKEIENSGPISHSNAIGAPSLWGILRSEKMAFHFQTIIESFRPAASKPLSDQAETEKPIPTSTEISQNLPSNTDIDDFLALLREHNPIETIKSEE